MCCRSPRGQRGVALLVALLVFAICATLLVALQRDFTRVYQRGSNRFLEEQGWAYLRGAEELAALALQVDFDSDAGRDAPRDDLTEIWAQEATPYALDEGGWMLGELADLQGRFNLNSLAAQPREGTGAARFTPEQALFIRMLQALEALPLTEFEAIAVTESIADWLDADEVPRLNGAESSSYTARTPAYRAANQPLRSVEELRAVANVTPALYLALEPLVTVWPQAATGINLHTAPLPLLRAINADDSLQPLSLADGETLLQQRQDPGFLDRDDFFSQPVFAEADLEGAAALFGESSSYFLLTARVEIADREQRLYSVLRRESRQVDVLLRMRAAL
jgi:general secretion pathway protein K